MRCKGQILLGFGLMVAVVAPAMAAQTPRNAAAGEAVDRLTVKSPEQTVPLEELARSRRIDVRTVKSPRDRMPDYAGPPARYAVDVEPDIEYGRAGGESLRLDLYRPHGAPGPRPGIVLIHGGGWRDRMGSRYSTAPEAQWFAARGFVAASVEYRLAPRHHWPAQLDDCQRAIRWVRANAEKYGIDPGRIASTGGSAGGHLSAMVGLVDTRDNSDPALARFSSQVNLALPQATAMVAWETSPKSESMLPDVFSIELFGAPAARIPPETRTQFALLPHVSPKAVPFFITQSKNDRLVAPSGPIQLCEALKKAGVDARIDLVDGTGGGHALKMSAAEYTRHDNLLWAFVEKHFRLASASDNATPPGAAKMQGIDQLPAMDELPDPFRMNDGTRVATHSDWAKRREEIKAMILYYEYGRMPPAPDNITATETSSTPTLDGTAMEKRITLSMGPDHKIRFRVGLLIPRGTGPFPAIVKNDRDVGLAPIPGEIVGRGYALAEYVRTDLDLDENDSVGSAQAAYPDYDWATLAVWAWGTSRVVDYLLTLDCIDKDRIAATGQSRGGKTALLAGALDERIALVAPNGSGCGGAGCYRVKQGETLDKIVNRFPYWFAPRFGQFREKGPQLPFDQHFVKALVAPRALISIDGIADAWANPLGTQQTYLAAQVVFDWLKAGGKNGIYVREGKHEQSADDWRTLLDFADLQFFGKPPRSGKRFNQLRFPDAKPLFSWTKPPLPAAEPRP